MFERFTDRARRALVVAQVEARQLHHPFIGTEHILLGLMREGEGLASVALADLGLDYETAKARVVEVVPPGAETLYSGKAPFTPRSKKALELSFREALRLGHNYIGTEHLLLGLIREREGVAAQVIAASGVDGSQVEAHVLRLIAEHVATSPPRPGRGWRRRGGRAPGPPGPPPRPWPVPRVPTTPAGERIPVDVLSHARTSPVASHHYLFAILDDPTSSASRVLASFGVTAEAAVARLADLGVAGTSDEVQPEESFAVETSGSGLTIRIKDADLAEAVRRGELTVSFERSDDGDDGNDREDREDDGSVERAVEEAVLGAILDEDEDGDDA